MGPAEQVDLRLQQRGVAADPSEVGLHVLELGGPVAVVETVGQAGRRGQHPEEFPRAEEAGAVLFQQAEVRSESALQRRQKQDLVSGTIGPVGIAFGITAFR